MTSRNLEILTRPDCLELLRTQFIGRVGVHLGEGISILPVNYAMLDEDIVVRTDPGTKLTASIMHVTVAFEVDSADPVTRTGWSVLVEGRIEEIVDAPTLERVATLDLDPWLGPERDRVLRIATQVVTGRRIPPHEPVS